MLCHCWTSGQIKESGRRGGWGGGGGEKGGRLRGNHVFTVCCAPLKRFKDHHEAKADGGNDE